jgi:hypothetical protein
MVVEIEMKNIVPSLLLIRIMTKSLNLQKEESRATKLLKILKSKFNRKNTSQSVPKAVEKRRRRRK